MNNNMKTVIIVSLESSGNLTVSLSFIFVVVLNKVNRVYPLFPDWLKLW